ncbi:oxidoreductase, short chain dehydrogenase/reductase family [marine gamma proteobacterium HTCC2148]|uniref:SDR family NAD(P)-dependent oxidoreductase n=1 Tax=Candidatus Seongchinamella marina TaxID=2518990 RepID=A0ABT3SSI2_9GAMM|nr:SDR family NAD(P)-dependent oxidoreductase [Candidatus Seongchinamella marina]EEB78423.1 oxidoreductase, short chain dehydrogenase/reductase family [marine gamma proteobacterium HTCC2148]MCX2972900.1 SDR family NAD(P)-dependent oxidoreductase [Candidatus Seongchinamella marina]
MGDLTGKVAVITGAGRGLGREEAIQLAKQGARVVINDIGLPDAIEAAQSAVEEIKSFGGEAMAVYGDCADSADAENLLKATLDSYGDMNIMINNAGFCRDKTIFGMSDEEFDSVVRVHLRGHFVNMRNATKYWREKAKAGDEVYGRLISTSSEAALYGSAGQPNYAAAKAGIVAMTMGAAQLLIKYGITANVIMPRALTDMTAGGQTAEMFAPPADGGFHAFDPANVAPLVGYLASPEAGKISGEVYVVWGNEVQVAQRPTLRDAFVNPKGATKWEVEDLHTSMASHYDDNYMPVWGGFSVPPV